MFEAQLDRAVLFKRVVEAIRELCTEVNLECSHEGIVLQAMDSSHVSLVHLHFKELAFERFRVDRMKVLGVNMESLAKIFKFCTSNDSVEIKCEEDGDFVEFTFENEDRGGPSSHFELKLLDVESEHLGIPEGQEYEGVVTLPAVELARICRDFREFGDCVTISCTKDVVKFSVDGPHGACNVQVMPRRDPARADEVTIKCREPVSASFTLRYLNFFTKATPLSESVHLEIAHNRPLIVEYHLGWAMNGRLRYFLAPKVDDI